MNKGQIRVIVFFFVFILLVVMVSIWINPVYKYNKNTNMPYLSNAFNNCINQNFESLASVMSKNGGYLISKQGVANLITIEKEIESNMDPVLTKCEALLLQEGKFVRLIKNVRVVVDFDSISVFIDGIWKDDFGNVLPGFVIRTKSNIGEASSVAEELIKQLDSSSLTRNIMLSTMGNGKDYATIKKDLLKRTNNYNFGSTNGYLVTFSVLPDQIRFGQKTIQFPMQVTLTKDKYEFSFVYPVSETDFVVGCDMLGDKPFYVSTPGNEILFDCGWYSCKFNWSEKLYLPKYCDKYAIYIDGKLTG